MRGAHKLLWKSFGILVNHLQFVDKFLLIVDFNRSTTHLIRLHDTLRFLILIYQADVRLYFVSLNER